MYFFKYAPLTLGLDNSSGGCEFDEYTDFDVFKTPPKQRARYHALHEQLLGFHISFEELVKRKKYLVLRVCPTLVQYVVCCSLLTVTVYGEA